MLKNTGAEKFYTNHVKDTMQFNNHAFHEADPIAFAPNLSEVEFIPSK